MIRMHACASRIQGWPAYQLSPSAAQRGLDGGFDGGSGDGDGEGGGGDGDAEGGGDGCGDAPGGSLM